MYLIVVLNKVLNSVDCGADTSCIGAAVFRMWGQIVYPARYFLTVPAS